MNKKEKKTLPAGVTPEILENWKSANKNGIAEIASGDYSAFIRRPTRDDMRELSAKGGTVDPVTYTEIILDQLWLGGDEEIRTNDDVFFGAMEVVQNVLDVQKATLVKL